MTINTSLDVQRIITEWGRYLKEQKGYSANTISAYITDFFYFLKFLSLHKGGIIDLTIIQELQLQDLRSWLAARNLSEKKATSNSRAVSVLRNFFKYLKQRYNIDNQAPFLIHIRNKNKPLPKALSIEEAIHSLQSIKTLHKEKWIGLRDYAILMLLYGAGLRISEALALTITDISDLRSAILKVRGKGSKERLVPILPAVANAVSEYASSCPYSIDKCIFFTKTGKVLSRQAFTHSITALKNSIIIPDDTSSHSFRHSFATHLMANGGEIRVIQELLGHESISTTQRYTKIENSQLISVYKMTHPRS